MYRKKSTKSKLRVAGYQAKVSAQAVPKTKYNIRRNGVWYKIKLLLLDGEEVEGVTTTGKHTPPRKVRLWWQQPLWPPGE